jgi:hypothetical protein
MSVFLLILAKKGLPLTRWPLPQGQPEGRKEAVMSTQQSKRRIFILRALRTVSFLMLTKGIIGGSVAMLAIFGVVVPLFGIQPTVGQEGAAAGVGAVLGALLAFKS